MKIIVCGAGQVGWELARHLAGEGIDVTVVDSDPDLVRRAIDTLDVQGVVGFASHPDVLENAGAPDADMLIAATRSDEVNMVTCQVAHSIFGITRKVARLRSQSYLTGMRSDLYVRAHFPIDVVISPEREVADAVLRRFAMPAAFDVVSFLDGQAELMGISLDDDCPAINTPLRQLSDLFSTLRAIVVGVRREGTLFVPEAGDQLFAGDGIYVLSHKGDSRRALEIFGKKVTPLKRVVIVGAGNVGLTVAKALENRAERVRTKIIERDQACAESAADMLDRTVVLCGDGLDVDTLAEAGIGAADAVLALTDDDKVNVLAAVRAKTTGVRMAICLVNDRTLTSLMAPLDIDAHIDPRTITVSSILRHIRLGQVSDVYSIGDAEAEVIEAEVLATAPVAGKRLRDIDFPEGVLVGAMKKGSEVIRPTSQTRIEVGDVIVIFAMASDVPEVERLLQVTVDYL